MLLISIKESIKWKHYVKCVCMCKYSSRRTCEIQKNNELQVLIRYTGFDKNWQVKVSQWNRNFHIIILSFVTFHIRYINYINYIIGTSFFNIGTANSRHALQLFVALFPQRNQPTNQLLKKRILQRTPRAITKKI